MIDVFLRRLPGMAPALLLAACTSMAPPYAAPPLPVPAAYPADAPMPAAGAQAARLEWADLFPDPALRHLVGQALAHNRDLRVAALRVEEARAAYGIQRAEQWPTLGLGAEGSRARVPGDLNVTGRSVITSSRQVGLGVNAWELDFWGRIASLRDAALQNYLASDAARRAVTVGLVAEVANAYLSLRELDERVAIARGTIASREESLRIFTRRFEVGSTSRLELSQVRTLLAQAQSLGAQLEQARAAQAHALAVLVGEPVALPAAPQGLDEGAVHPLAAGLPSDLLAARPDILAAEHRLRAAQANIGAARAAFFPRITLTGSLGTASAELDGLFQGGSRAWSFAPSLALPLFDAGRNQSNLDLAQARRDIAVASYEKAVQAAFREVADGLTAQQAIADQVHIQQTALAAQQDRARLARLRYDHGATTFLEVLDAQRDLLSAEQQLVQTRRALLSARVGLYAALGGGAQTLPAAPETP
ncbi:MAG: efflux transporter outer membrane subunit [Acidovorax sp.]|nr:efflux transporter outer membrane subunit [Acidovorax sp.]